jgi:hypothetical protein
VIEVPVRRVVAVSPVPPPPVNEIVGLTAAAFLLALPGMVNGIFRIIKAIKDKAPPKYRIRF